MIETTVSRGRALSATVTDLVHRNETVAKILTKGWLSMVILVLWELSVHLFNIERAIFPPPSAVIQAVYTNAGELAYHAGITLTAIAIGLVIGTVAGLLFSILLFYNLTSRKTIYPLLVTIAIIPKIALAPIIVVWFGSGLNTAITLTALIVFFPVMVNMYSGLRDIDEQKLMLAQSYGVSEFFIFRTLRLPYAAPYFVTSMKLAVVFSFIGAIVAEFIAAGAGLGYLIINFSIYGQTTNAFAGIAVIGVLSLVPYGIVSIIDRRYFAYANDL